MSHLAKPPPLKPLMANGLTIFRLPEPPLMVMCKAHEHAKHATLGGSGVCPPGNFEILHSLRLNLRAFLVIDFNAPVHGHRYTKLFKM